MEGKAVSSYARKVILKMHEQTRGLTKNTELDILIEDAENFLKENDFFSAAQNYKTILNIYGKQKKPSLDVANIHRKLGYLYREAGMYNESLDNYKKACDIARKALSGDSPALCEIYLEMSETYMKEDRFHEATELLEKALEITEASDKCEKALTLQIQQKLGETRAGVYRYNDAFKLLQNALCSTLNLEGNQDVVTDIMFTMGKAYSRKGNLEEALHYLKKVLKAHEETGQKTKKLAELYEELSSVNLRLNNFDEADITLLRALYMKEELYKESHVEVAKTHIAYGLLYFYQNLNEEAMTHLNTAIKVLENYYGKNHYQLSRAYRSRSLIYVFKKDYSKAIADMETTVNILKRLHGHNYVTIGEAYIDQANIYLALNDYKTAYKLLRAGSKILKLWWGIGHPNVSEAYLKTCKVCLVLGKTKKAEKKFKRAVNGLFTALEKNVEDTIESFSFAKMFELYDLHENFAKCFEPFSNRAKKFVAGLVKDEKDKKSITEKITYIFDKYRRKRKELKKVLGWAGLSISDTKSASMPCL